MKTAVVQ